MRRVVTQVYHYSVGRARRFVHVVCVVVRLSFHFSFRSCSSTLSIILITSLSRFNPREFVFTLYILPALGPFNILLGRCKRGTSLDIYRYSLVKSTFRTGETKLRNVTRQQSLRRHTGSSTQASSPNESGKRPVWRCK